MASFPIRNIGLKFLSICIAGLLWLVVAGDRIVERALRVPVEYQNLPTGLEIVGDPLQTVDVRLRGSSGTLGRLAPSDTSAVIDLRNARTGRRLFHLTATQVRVPYGTEVVQVAPATLSIEFENSAVRILQIRPSLEGNPAPGFEVVGVTSDPTTIEVVGPESSLRGLDEAMTEPVSIANAKGSIREIVNVGVADPSVRLRDSQTATVTVQIGPGAATRTLSAVPITIINIADGLRAQLLTATVSVQVKGTQAAIDELTLDSVQARINASGLDAGDHALDVQVQTRQGLIIETIAPRTAKLRITKP